MRFIIGNRIAYFMPIKGMMHPGFVIPMAQVFMSIVIVFDPIESPRTSLKDKF